MSGLEILRAVGALGLVLALIALGAWFVRRSALPFLKTPARAGAPRRLDVVEVQPIDMRRKLVLLRRDDVEHLVLLSPTAETVVETGIRREDAK